MTPSDRSTVDEAEARRVLLLQAFESAPEGPLWTAEDRAWATRLARQTVGEAATPARFVSERARHALERLGPRVPAAQAWLRRRGWDARWWWAAAVAAFVAGLLLDHIGGDHSINLLAPPAWALMAWNLLAYVIVALLALRSVRAPGGAPRGLRRWLQRAWIDRAPGGAAAPAPMQDFAAAWARQSTPLAARRAAALLHAAAAALALGLVAGMYLRGLVLEYRAGWQSTFLEAATVQAALDLLLAPASGLTGIAVPEVAPLRVSAGAAAAGPAAPWIHLYAAMLALGVVLPRLALSGWALGSAARLSRRMPLPWEEPYFQRLTREGAGRSALVEVVPHAAAPGAAAVLALRERLALELGDEVQLRIGATVAHGDEEGAAAAADAGCTHRAAWFDMAATPDPESQGRLLQALRRAAPALPLRLVVDETAFVQRFGTLPERLAQRRAAWQAFGDAQGAAAVFISAKSPAETAVVGGSAAADAGRSGPAWR
jgi:hypothetical protein